ncbi:MAG: DUF3515 domain-containing protein [Actinomycetota bacterium]|nr:DUF3515 domain-containing protein [Actinomycetota bacterium]
MSEPASRTVGVALLGLAATCVATGCGGPVEVIPPPVGEDRSACRALVDALPERLAGAESRAVEPPDAAVTAWGDPPIVLRCGVPRPSALARTSRCDLVNHVGWFTEEQARSYRFTTIGREANVEVVVPFSYDPAAEVLVGVADAVKASVRRVRPCV